MVKFYCHDVLQTEFLTSLQLKLGLDLFTFFKEGMDVFGTDKEVVLLTLAEGIDKHPEWVEYIKAHPNYKIECHGWDHIDYRKIPYSEVVDKLKKAKAKLEETFNQEVTLFHPPKNFYNEETIKATAEAGMTLRNEYMGPKRYQIFNLPFNYADIHYWVREDMKRVKPIMDMPPMNKMTFILGSPRSGTTALLRYLTGKNPDVHPLREVEWIWKETDEDIKKYYEEQMKKSGKSKILDKNARNGARLERILRLYPDADYIHIIRDGRAVANSRRTLDMRIGRYDETIEKAAYEWIHFVTYIRNRRGLIKNYREVRYEDLCRYTPYFISQNGKWKNNLNKSQRIALTRIEEPLLKELEYIR